ncbi:hypothetical protein EDB83DRAFT_2431969 [Lactarius deliciosus]|nr:hypothetical protein EDB83DRAFT_2431969 [Lactarius deliciosus]
MSAYSATKFAVRGLTQAAAREFGKHGITANAHSPGVMDTSMIDPLRATDGTSPLPLDAITASTPVRRLARLGTPDNVAGPSLVSYLASTLALSLVNVCASFLSGPIRSPYLAVTIGPDVWRLLL